MTSPAVSNPLQPFLTWCDALGIAQKDSRHAVLINSVKAQSHETVLFFLCAQDYIYNPTDLKGHGLENLFIGQGAPFEINISAAAVVSFKQMVHNPTPGGGVKAGGAGNYNLCTKAILSAVQGFGAVFLRDMVKGVNAARSGQSPVTSTRIAIELQDMRNRTRRFWMSELPALGL